MLELIGLIAVFGVLAWLCNKGAKFCFRMADLASLREAHKKYHEEQLLASVKGIEKSVTEPEGPNEMDRLLAANQEVMEKRNLTKAIKEELGIE